MWGMRVSVCVQGCVSASVCVFVFLVRLGVGRRSIVLIFVYFTKTRARGESDATDGWATLYVNQ